MSEINKKILMTMAGLFWVIYLVLHMFINLNFLAGSESYNSFYTWFHNAIILRWTVWLFLIISIFTHIFIAVSRQLDSNSKRTTNYKKTYPKAIPRLVAWSGAGLLASFIVFHFIQMQTVITHDLYSEITAIFYNPFMLVIYGLGFIALGAHLYHSLTNVGQTMGWSSKQRHFLISFFVFTLIVGFSSAPIRVWL